MNFTYRELGPKIGVPPIFLTQLAAVLDNWDPRVVDGIAAKHRVITFDNEGVGASTGSTPDTIQAMAKDAINYIRALGLDEVDLLAFSMGGMIAQVIVLEEPQLVRRLILAGTGPGGGEGIEKLTAMSNRDLIRGLLTFQDPKQFLFFTSGSDVTGIGILYGAVNPAGKPVLPSNRSRVTPEPVASDLVGSGRGRAIARVWRTPSADAPLAPPSAPRRSRQPPGNAGWLRPCRATR